MTSISSEHGFETGRNANDSDTVQGLATPNDSPVTTQQNTTVRATRHPFTQEESRAIERGVKVVVDERRPWETIRKLFITKLGRRTSTQIKDRARTLLKHNVISQSDYPRCLPQRASCGTTRRCKPNKKWTAMEKQAVREGVIRFGKGEWKQIKDHFKDELKDRTNVQIKDCYRTMVKRGEIQEAVPVHEQRMVETFKM